MASIAYFGMNNIHNFYDIWSAFVHSVTMNPIKPAKYEST